MQQLQLWAIVSAGTHLIVSESKKPSVMLQSESKVQMRMKHLHPKEDMAANKN